MTHIAALLLAFCQWCNGSFFGHGIRDSVWLFPFVEIFHLLALGLLGGTVLLLNMTLLGVRFRGQPIEALARDVRPWMLGSIAVMLLSGFLLFSTEAVKMYGNRAFQLKMCFLALALLFTFTVHRRVTSADDGQIGPRWRGLIAVVSILLWVGVALAGRAIGYVTTSAASVGGVGS
ncbi:MAG TPA: DUF6644 family protein [Steroidobacteraceae bacterium]|nr:DUF6644 family protein [Steroidobacteraceae bacterium]